MAKILNFPHPFRRRAEGDPRASQRFRDATRRRLRAIIANALAILDSMEQDAGSLSDPSPCDREGV